jgi:hypothetical protein
VSLVGGGVQVDVAETLTPAERHRRWCDAQRQMELNLHRLLLNAGLDRDLLDPDARAAAAALPPFPTHLLTDR